MVTAYQRQTKLQPSMNIKNMINNVFRNKSERRHEKKLHSVSPVNTQMCITLRWKQSTFFTVQKQNTRTQSSGWKNDKYKS